MPAQVADIHGEQQTVLTAGDLWGALKWWASGFLLIGLVAVVTAFVRVNDMVHNEQELHTQILAQDSAIGGHANARLQLQSLRQTLDQVQAGLTTANELQRAIAAAVHARVP